MFLDPPDICKVALLNRAFHGASLADFVWETKLPSNYKFMVRKVFQESPENLTKKYMYARLCQLNNFFDDGSKQVWLDKRSGKICLSISYKGLKITGIDDRRYWNHIASQESRFHTIAYLQQIWWFEVVGEMELEFPPGTYTLFYKLQLAKPSKRSFGLHGYPTPTRIKSMDGISNLSDSSSPHPTASVPCPNVTCMIKKESGMTGFTYMEVNL